MTVELLNKIERVVNIYIQKELVTWVAILTGFNLTLRKGNLVPVKRVHDAVHNVVRGDIRFTKGVMMVYLRLSKTNQFRQKVKYKTMMADEDDPICPVRWMMYMVNTIPAKSHHNLLSYVNKYGNLVPITYRDLMTQMRAWLKLVGVKDVKSFSSHSLRRGSTTRAFKKGLPERTIMEMGDWSSDCYKRYIDLDLNTRMHTWLKFANKN